MNSKESAESLSGNLKKRGSEIGSHRKSSSFNVSMIDTGNVFFEKFESDNQAEVQTDYCLLSPYEDQLSQLRHRNNVRQLRKVNLESRLKMIEVQTSLRMNLLESTAMHETSVIQKMSKQTNNHFIDIGLIKPKYLPMASSLLEPMLQKRIEDLVELIKQIADLYKEEKNGYFYLIGIHTKINREIVD